ncbi:MAG TPA: hypothetical protein VFL82_06970 [Thermomicrobiales bacterium]|nr:hypothetical protein [Thermomicrobiales bacterium]
MTGDVRSDIEVVCDHIRHRVVAGKRFSITLVAEGARIERGKAETTSDDLNKFGHLRLGGVGEYLAKEFWPAHEPRNALRRFLARSARRQSEAVHS